MVNSNPIITVIMILEDDDGTATNNNVDLIVVSNYQNSYPDKLGSKRPHLVFWAITCRCAYDTRRASNQSCWS